MIPPIAPFAPKIHGRLNFPVIVVFIAATLLFHPFTQTAPMKVRFLQQVHLGKQAYPLLTEQAYGSVPYNSPGLLPLGRGSICHHNALRPFQTRTEDCF